MTQRRITRRVISFIRALDQPLPASEMATLAGYGVLACILVAVLLVIAS